MMKTLSFSRLLERVCRWYVFLFLNVYGWGKMLGGQFYRRGQLPPEVGALPLEEVPGFELAGTFMGYSQAYILFIGISQVIGAWLLLFNRTKLLGAMVLTPIMVNVVVFDLIFLDQKGALANATLYLLMLGYLCYHNRAAVKEAVQALMRQAHFPQLPAPSRWRELLIAGLLFGLIFGVDQFIVNLLGH